MSDTQSRAELLNQPIPVESIRVREGGGGTRLSYVDGHYVFDRLNTIYGPEGWSYLISSLEHIVTEGHGKQREDGTYPKSKVSYLCRVQLHVLGAHGQMLIEDVGFGSSIDRSEGAAHEGAAKEAVTDAVKRAARKLGNSVGLALYEREQTGVDFLGLRDQILRCETNEQLDSLRPAIETALDVNQERGEELIDVARKQREQLSK